MECRDSVRAVSTASPASRGGPGRSGDKSFCGERTCSEGAWEHQELPPRPAQPSPLWAPAETEGSLPQSPGSSRSPLRAGTGWPGREPAAAARPPSPAPPRALPLPPGYSPPAAAAPSRRGRAAARRAAAAGPAPPGRAARAARARPPAARRARGPRSPPPPPSWPPQEGRGGGQRAAGNAGRAGLWTPRTTTPSVHRGGGPRSQRRRGAVHAGSCRRRGAEAAPQRLSYSQWRTRSCLQNRHRSRFWRFSSSSENGWAVERGAAAAACRTKVF